MLGIFNLGNSAKRGHGMLTESPVFTAVLYLKFVAVQEQHLKCMLQMLDHELKYGCKAPQIPVSSTHHTHYLCTCTAVSRRVAIALADAVNVVYSKSKLDRLLACVCFDA